MFQKSVLSKHLVGLSQQVVEQRFQDCIRFFGDMANQELLRNTKEEEYQDGFLRKLFVDILGYTLKPDSDFNLVREKKNETDSQKADAAILVNGKVIGVIELKDLRTIDLSKVEQQAFGYKNHHRDASYVITSNFQKIRFYIDNAVDFLEFDLFNLTRSEFELLYLCLSWDSIRNNLPKKIKAESAGTEESITVRFYKDYSAFKTSLFHDLCENNSALDQLTLFRKTQKLLDRLLFIFFAEDKGLLNPNEIRKIIKQWENLQELDAYDTLYNRFKKYFGYLNTGNKEADVFPYNGGLFQEDPVLDSVSITDSILREHSLRLAEYNFDSEVDVNILGHIFEHSLAEIETITKQLNGDSPAIAKRKKEGIFYTPQYITKFIVENTLGTLCEQKKLELGVREEMFEARKRNKKDRKRFHDLLDSYRNWLLNLKICDPACGSGAFLNQAMDFLITEHHRIDEYHTNIEYENAPKRSQAVFTFRDVETVILENNLYGVDINEEAVEIAKLSLWLRSAEKGRKLNDLSNRIKIGDSLIIDPEIAGEKAFDWEKEFPEVFAKGGFDCVIGNPPYVRVQRLKYGVIDYLKTHYKTAMKRIDISLCFIELSKKLLKSDSGLSSFITSNQFLTTEYGQEMRRFLLKEFRLIRCVDFGDLPIFPDALTYVSIFVFQNSLPGDFQYVQIPSITDAQDIESKDSKTIRIKQLSNSSWNLKSYDLRKIFSKLGNNSIEIGSIGNAWAGVITGNDSILMFTKNEIKSLGIEKELLLPVIRANNCDRFYCSEPEMYVIYPYKYENGKTLVFSEEELRKSYPKTYQYFLKNSDELKKRKDSRKTFGQRKDWYSLVRFGQINIFHQPKIVCPGEVKDHKFSVDTSGAGFSCARVFAITVDDTSCDINYVLCLLNSKLIRTFLQSFSSLKSGGYYTYSSNVLNKVPLKIISKRKQKFCIEKSQIMSKSMKKICEKRNVFHRLLTDNVNPNLKITKNLESFEMLEFKDLLSELAKQGSKIALKNQEEWNKFFQKSRQEIRSLQEVVDKTDREIDRFVYELYELTDDEVALIETS